MAYAYATLLFKKRPKYICLWKDSDLLYRWYDLNGRKIRRIQAAKSISDAKINAWEVYGDIFDLDYKSEISLDNSTNQ